MLPSVICLTAFAFRPPRLLTTGACALFWYCENDQSLGLVEDEVIGLDPLKSGRWRRKAILGEEMCIERCCCYICFPSR
jgi:hypothetical protein